MADKYCTRCGYGNLLTRGACLICLDYLDVEGRGVTCPNPECGLENGKQAIFCKYCGIALDDEEVAIPGIVEAALSISNALTGGASDEFDDEEEMSEEDAAAFADFQREQAETRGETTEEAAAAAEEAAVEEEEEEELARPSALDLEQDLDERLTPPPPPREEAPAFDEEAEGALSFNEEEEAAPAAAEAEVTPLPPSEPVVAGPQPAAAALPAGELSEDDLIPSVPSDLPGFDDDVATPSAAAAPAVAPEAETAEDEIPDFSEAEDATTEVPADEDAKASSEGDLDGWALDFDDES